MSSFIEIHGQIPELLCALFRKQTLSLGFAFDLKVPPFVELPLVAGSFPNQEAARLLRPFDSVEQQLFVELDALGPALGHDDGWNELPQLGNRVQAKALQAQLLRIHVDFEQKFRV